MDNPNQTSQTQQPLNPTLPTVNSDKSKLVPIILGVAAAIVIAIGAFVLGTNQSQAPFQSQKECEDKTGKKCSLEMCQGMAGSAQPAGCKSGFYPYEELSSATTQPTPDPTANWQTYHNDEFGFELKYPWNFFDRRADGKDIADQLKNNRFGAIVVSFADETWQYQGVANPALHVIVMKTSLSPREWLDTYLKPVLSEQSGNIPEPPVGYRNVQEVSINGMSTLQFDQLFTSGSAKSSVIQKKPDTLYNIMASSNSLGSFPPQLYNQILSTFKFTSP